MGKIQCIVCQKRCRGTVMKIDQSHIHKSCFKCKLCNKNLDETNFHFRDQYFYCPEDYQLEYSIKCSSCGKQVEGDMVIALGKTFHNFCLRCFACNRSLKAGEKTVALGDRFYCVLCVPPQLPTEDDVELLHPANNATGQKDVSFKQNGEFVIKPTEAAPPSKKTPPKRPTTPGSPRKLANFFRSRKHHTLPPGSTIKNTSPDHSPKRNGTEALTINVGDADRNSTDSGIGKKFEPDQSPCYSLYSGEEQIVAKSRSFQNTQSPEPDYRVYTLPIGYSQSTATDAALTTPSLGQNLSTGNSTLLYGSVRRIFPDFGQQYPISYLRLAEQGLTALTSIDDLRTKTLSSLDSSQAHLRNDGLSSCGTYRVQSPGTNHISRRDMLPPKPPSVTHTRTVPSSQNEVDEKYSSIANDLLYTPQVFGANGRPEKDRYNRNRQLSPAASTTWAANTGRRTLPGFNGFIRKDQTYSSFSTPNMSSRKAESLLRSQREPRSLSPESANLYQTEARRMAAYPGGHIPDANSEPAIDRYDFPAPPSSAVVMLDRRRERAFLEAQRSGASTLDGTLLTSEFSGGSNADTLSPDLRDNHCSPSPRRDEEVARIAEKIDALKRVIDSSGMASAILPDLEHERQIREDSPDLDPISASRTPSAKHEPSYRTRYTNHRFASPSRSTLRRETGHCTALFNNSTSGIGAGRWRTLGGPLSNPRPGYTSGLLSSPRTVSLPRAVNEDARDWYKISRDNEAPVSAAQRRLQSTAYNNRTHSTDAAQQLGDSRDGALSIGASGLSIDGFAESNYTNSMGQRTCSSALTGMLPPPSISGLRPVPRNLRSPRDIRHQCRSSTLSAYINGLNGSRKNPRTMSEGAPNAYGTLRQLRTNFNESEEQNQIEQIKLKPSMSLPFEKEKIYSYDELKNSSNANLKGINLHNREVHLSPEEFQRLFKMTYAAFVRLPEWKRNDIKRRLDLL